MASCTSRLALFSVFVLVLGNVAFCSPSKLLSWPGGFKLKARLVSQVHGDEEISTSEFYSNEQQRSRLELRGSYSDSAKHSGNIFKYFYDAQSRALIRTSRRPGEATTVGRGAILFDLFGELAQEEHIRDWHEAMKEQIPPYVNGLARLLLIMEANRDKMVKTNLSKGSLKMRNQPVDRYQLKLDYWAGKVSDLTVVAYYGTDTFALGALNIPLRVFFKASYGSFFIEYSFLETIEPTSPEKGIDFHLDLFSFPVGLGCAKLLGPTVSQNLTLPKVVSMQLEVEDFWVEKMPVSVILRDQKLKGRHFVAYDGFQQVLRQDTIKTYTQHGQSSYSTTIHDLKTSKYYNIRRDLREQPEAANSTTSARIFNKMNLNLDSDVECVVTRASPHFDYQSLLPLRELTDMGVAFVRGIKTRMLEHETKELPPLIFQQVMYKDTHKKNVSTSNTPIQPSDTFTVVYYLSHDFHNQSNSDIGPIIRLDLIHNFDKIYQVDVYDMVWQLAEAPNGDHQTELFSVQDYCSSGNRVQRQATLSIDLDFVDGLQKNHIGLDEVQRLVASPQVRNKAILRGLSSSIQTGVSAVDLSNLESRVNVAKQVNDAKLADQKSGLRILLTARVASLHEQLYSASAIATVASLTPEAQPTDADSFAECYWEAAHARSRGPVLFSYYGGLCYIDFNPKIEWNEEEKSNLFVGSSIFRIDWTANSRFELLQFIQDNQVDANLEVSRWDIFGQLTDEVLQLPIVDTQSPNEQPQELQFQVSRVEIGNNKWPLDNLYEEEHVLKGLGLVDGTNPSEPDQSHLIVDPDSCHSACTVDLTCRSYSVCVGTNGIECKTSELSFRDSNLLSTINKEKSAKKAHKSFTVEFKPYETKNKTDNDDDDDDHIPERLIYELKVDKRCRIYNKRALELFKELPKTQTTVKKREIRQVDNEEECAELCLARNVKQMRKLAKLRLRSPNRDKVSGKTTSRATKVSLKSWCASFKYLDLRTTSLSDDFLRTYRLKDVHKGGICLLSRISKVQPESDAINRHQLRLKMDNFEFVYRNLYQMQPGVRLLQMDTASGDMTNNIRENFLENSQKIVEASDLELCSRYCFTQTVGLIPSCKSFDLVEMRTELPSADTNRSSSSNRRFKTTTYCVFNSISLREASKSGNKVQLISTDVQVGLRAFHFEPRQEYVLGGLAVVEEAQKRSRMSFKSQLNLLLVIVIGIVSGIALGHLVKGPIVWRWLSHGNTVDSPLDSLIEGHDDNFENAQHKDNL